MKQHVRPAPHRHAWGLGVHNRAIPTWIPLFFAMFHFSHAAVQNVTVSGVSAGGFFAVQYHIAFSSEVTGAGVIAGGPFYCAELGGAVSAQSQCMKNPAFIDVDALLSITKNTELTRTIDLLDNLQNSRVFLFSGTLDSVVNPGVVKKLELYYSKLISTAENIQTQYNISAEHAMITNSYGNACSFRGEPYINNCNYDLVGNIFQHLYPNMMDVIPSSTTSSYTHTHNPIINKNSDDPLSAPIQAQAGGELLSFQQAAFLPIGYTLDTAALSSRGYVYRPRRCAQSATTSLNSTLTAQEPCLLHVAFHGCEQNAETVGEQFMLNAGYNSWADANQIVILFPQTKATPLNPKGCFDWWGFTGVDYACKLGAQMQAVNNMVKAVASGKLYQFLIQDSGGLRD